MDNNKTHYDIEFAIADINNSKYRLKFHATSMLFEKPQSLDHIRICVVNSVGTEKHVGWFHAEALRNAINAFNFKKEH